MTIGAIILPSNSPNFIQTKFKGVKSLELNIPKTKKNNETASDQILNDCSPKSGQIPTKKKTTKKTKPKLLFELIFSIYCQNNYIANSFTFTSALDLLIKELFFCKHLRSSVKNLLIEEVTLSFKFSLQFK